MPTKKHTTLTSRRKKPTKLTEEDELIWLKWLESTGQKKPKVTGDFEKHFADWKKKDKELIAEEKELTQQLQSRWSKPRVEKVVDDIVFDAEPKKKKKKFKQILGRAKERQARKAIEKARQQDSISKKGKKKKKNPFILDEAEVSSDDEGQDEDEEGLDKDLEGLVVPDEEKIDYIPDPEKDKEEEESELVHPKNPKRQLKRLRRHPDSKIAIKDHEVNRLLQNAAEFNELDERIKLRNKKQGLTKEEERQKVQNALKELAKKRGEQVEEEVGEILLDPIPASDQEFENTNITEQSEKAAEVIYNAEKTKEQKLKETLERAKERARQARERAGESTEDLPEYNVPEPSEQRRRRRRRRNGRRSNGEYDCEAIGFFKAVNKHGEMTTRPICAKKGQ